MEEYGFFLSFNGLEDLFRLPVNPETLEIKESGDSKSYTIVGLGEINAIAYPKLTEITIDSVFPAQHYPFVVVGKKGQNRLLRPFEYVLMIQKWMKSRRPIRFVLSGVSLKGEREDSSAPNDFALNMAASIESFSWKLSAGTSGDIEYSLSLKKYVFYQASPVKIVKGEAKTEPKRASDKTAPKTYTMKAGDNLWSIAKKILGDGQKYKVIQKLNGIKDSELKKLPIGKVLKLP
ncbi:peptidoglycan-binding protein LysM [Paenibacillus albidus]|uniref:Peptidoglycan-binding protein LysM n=1 Tax=Paenibacillus albidus TaxID=2041023 RepID=A0A917D2E8_9BACL|nr:LysM peptidoglycan-binding domain-containing protein [Paenibacillus albidus]GGG06766.1 peptidoglycan-binding protein LysM [Paenibacillus albidus]